MRHFRPRVCLKDRKWRRAPKEDGSGAVPRVGLSHAADPHLSFARVRGPSPSPPFISPRESNRAIDATAIIRNRPRRCCLAGNDARVFHLLFSSFRVILFFRFLYTEWKRIVDSCPCVDSKELDIELEICYILDFQFNIKFLCYILDKGTIFLFVCDNFVIPKEYIVRERRFHTRFLKIWKGIEAKFL